MPAPLRQPAAASALEQTETTLAAAQDAYERAGSPPWTRTPTPQPCAPA